jgi:hypothetical protein
MWLHATALNDERQRAGRPRISAFWFWGGDKEPGTASPSSEPSPASFVIHGADVWLSGLAHATGATANKPASNFGELDPVLGHHIVELSPMSAPRESLVDAEARWFAPARVALSEGKLASLDIVANDRWFRIGARAGWRWWRKRRDWYDSLSLRTSSKA